MKIFLPLAFCYTLTLASPLAEAGEPSADLWALQALGETRLPAVRDTSWPRNSIDHFVLARLEEAGLKPAAPADKIPLLRRVYIDLIGLPPTREAAMEFSADRSPDAYEKLVDRLLSSPRYGERWGRHWLDVARYSDTKGYVFFEHPKYAHAYTYRDYVIDAFNRDLPYDRFVLEQLAADQLPDADTQTLSAMGFLTLGRRFTGNIYDIIDDRIDVVCRGLMALTVNCARCHDHKFDAIPTEDYYSLYGVFASCVEPMCDKRPLLAQTQGQDTPATIEYRKEFEKRRDDYYGFLREKRDDLVDQLRTRVGDYLEHVVDLEEEPNADIYLSYAPDEIRPPIVYRWYHFLQKADAEAHPVFVPWHRLRSLGAEDFAAGVKPVLEELAKKPASEVNPIVMEALEELPPESLQKLAQAYGEIFRRRYEIHRQRVANTNGDGREYGRKTAAEKEILAVLLGPGTPTEILIEETALFIDRRFMDKAWTKHNVLEGVDVELAGAPPRAMPLFDGREPFEPRVFVRGDPNVPGRKVPRQWLGLLSRGDAPSREFKHGSGRLELARKIVSPENPLFARVLVNRVWRHHFGEAIVRTLDDFGARSDPPTHPDLLGHLARSFIAGGWSIKSLHRQILLSNAYRQGSQGDVEKHKRDPENKLLWRMNPRRVEWEVLRDSMLFVAGRLDLKIGGRPVSLVGQPFSRRRTVYGEIDRQDLPEVFRMFDLASPDTTTAERHETLVPQQALFLMNSPFVVEQAREIARRPEIAQANNNTERLRLLYQTVLSRSPDAAELAAGKKYLETDSGGLPGAQKLSAVEKLAQVLLLTNDFVYLD